MEEGFWYLEWEAYFKEEYTAAPPEEPVSLIIWHELEETWYRFNDRQGVYEILKPTRLGRVFTNWADENGIKTSNNIVNHALNRLKGMVGTDVIWDNGHLEHYTNIENILDGLLDIKTKTLIPHTAAYLSKQQVCRHYLSQIVEPPAKITKLYSATPDWERLHKFMVAMVHKIMDDEMFLMAYGKRGSGKSTFLQLGPAMYGRKQASKTKLQKLGTSFGLARCYDKRMNVCPDLAPLPIEANTVSTLKMATGDDGDLEVNIKGVPQFEWPVLCFFLFGANQLMKFAKSAAEEVESIMRRACLVHYPKAQPRDPAFKKSLVEATFLDELFSYYVNCEYVPIMEVPLDDWVDVTLEQWLLDADPVMRILQEEYQFTDKYSSHDKQYMPIYAQISCVDVVEHVRSIMQAENFNPPADLQADVTQAFKSMKVLKNNKRGQNSAYIKVQKKPDDGPKTPEPTEPTAPQQMDAVLQKKAPVVFHGFDDVDDTEAHDLQVLAQSKRNHLNLILTKIRELQREEPTEPITVVDVFEPLSTISGMTHEIVKHTMEEWHKDGVLYNPSEDPLSGQYKLASKKLF